MLVDVHPVYLATHQNAVAPSPIPVDSIVKPTHQVTCLLGPSVAQGMDDLCTVCPHFRIASYWSSNCSVCFSMLKDVKTCQQGGEALERPKTASDTKKVLRGSVTRLLASHCRCWKLECCRTVEPLSLSLPLKNLVKISSLLIYVKIKTQAQVMNRLTSPLC